MGRTGNALLKDGTKAVDRIIGLDPAGIELQAAHSDYLSELSTHLVKLILNLKQKTGHQFLAILCVRDMQKCRQLKNQSGLVSFLQIQIK